MMLNVKTGEYLVLDSGVFHVAGDEKTSISLGSINIELIFEKKDGENPSVDFRAKNSQSAQIRLVNVSGGPLGFGTTRPFQIGESDGKALFLTFVTRSLDDPYLRTFEYTLYTK